MLARPSRCLSKSLARALSSTAPSPLHNVRVLDLTRILAGPYATMILGDLGAEIIKVEQPGVGDDTRRWGPPFLTDSENKHRESCYFLCVNRNKKSVCVDLKHEQGKLIIRELASRCDVLVENFVPGKMDSLGLGYSDLSAVAPQLVYCSITGFGSDGPYAKRAGYDVIAASVGGLMHITGPRDGPPCKVGVAMTDLCTGLYAHGAILAALWQRKSTGRGQKIDCNLLSTQVSTLANVASNYINSGMEAKRLGTEHASIVPYQTFGTRNGFLTVGAGNDHQFVELCARIDEGHLAKDARFATNEKRVQNRVDLVARLDAKFKTKTNEEWQRAFSGAGFPYGPVNTLEGVFADEQVRHNQMERTLPHDALGTCKVVGPAVKFSDSLNAPRSGPPTLGRHTHQVLKEMLGYSQEELNALTRSGAIA